MVTPENKKIVEDFERMVNLAKARAFSKLSLERPLSDKEFNEYKDTMKKLGIEV